MQLCCRISTYFNDLVEIAHCLARVATARRLATGSAMGIPPQRSLYQQVSRSRKGHTETKIASAPAHIKRLKTARGAESPSFFVWAEECDSVYCQAQTVI